MLSKNNAICFDHLKNPFLLFATYCLIFLQLQTTIEGAKSISQSFAHNITQSFSSFYSAAGNLNITNGGNILAQYNKQSGENPNTTTKTGLNGSTLQGDFTDNQQLSYLSQLDSSKTLYNPITDINKSWDQTSRGLTEAGQAVVAITASALTAGAMNPGTNAWLIGATVSASTVASTATITAINSGLNANGDIFKQLKTISKDSWDASTSRQTIQNAIVAGATATLTAGLTNIATGGSFTTAANSAPITNQGIVTNLQTSFSQVATQTVVSSSVQSAINGDSFTDAFKNAAQNIIIQTIAKVAANEIGKLAHPANNQYALTNPLTGEMTTTPQIGITTQLLLHAALGCAVGAASNGGGSGGGSGGCGSGAVAGVVGEATAMVMGSQINDSRTIIDTSKIIGAIASTTYGGLTNQTDEEMANNAWAGSRIAGNAAENNYLTRKVFGKETEEKLDKVLSEIKGKTLDEIADKYVASNDPIEKAGLFAILSINSVTLPSSTTELELMIATAGISTAFANPLARGLNKVDEVGSNWWGRVFGKQVGSNVSLNSGVDFYVGENGVAIPSTGYRAIGGGSVDRAMNGNAMSATQPFTYFTFDDISKLNPAETKSLLQLPKEPSHYVKFDTLHQFDNIGIPMENWNRGSIPEPITKYFGGQNGFGAGGGTQVITSKPIENFTLKPLNQGGGK